MTREEAIRIIETVFQDEYVYKYYDSITHQALRMAIEALTEPINCVKCKHYYETEDDTDVHGHCRMDTAHTNLISRADALMELNGVCSNWQDDAKVADIIHALPSADVVSREELDRWKGYYNSAYMDGFMAKVEEVIVHCKDCKWYECGGLPCPLDLCESLGDDGFCSRGER